MCDRAFVGHRGPGPAPGARGADVLVGDRSGNPLGALRLRLACSRSRLPRRPRWGGGCGDGHPSLPAVWPGALAVAVVGVAFAIAVGLRVHDLRQHPIVSRYGATATVTVTPGESPRFLGGSRLMFRGSLQSLDGVESSGRVVVFASVAGYDDLTAGRPVTFRARVGRPTRAELTVAVLSATGEPTLGVAPGWQRVAARVRGRLRR